MTSSRDITADIREAIREVVTPLSAQLEHERQRADSLQAKLNDAMTAERTASEEAAGLRISERGAVAEVAAQQLEVTERQACALRTELAELRKTEKTALDWAKSSKAQPLTPAICARRRTTP